MASRLSGRTVFDECLSVFDELRDDGDRSSKRSPLRSPSSIPKLPNITPPPTASLRSIHAFSAHDGYALDAKVGTVLSGLGFSKEDWHAPNRRILRRLADAHRAGQTAAAEARTCCCSTSRPTISIWKRATGWKSIYSTYPNALRADLARPLFSRRHGRTRSSRSGTSASHFYHGNYEKYLTQKDERRAQLEAAYRNQREQHRPP